MHYRGKSDEPFHHRKTHFTIFAVCTGTPSVDRKQTHGAVTPPKTRSISILATTQRRAESSSEHFGRIESWIVQNFQSFNGRIGMLTVILFRSKTRTQ